MNKAASRAATRRWPVYLGLGLLWALVAILLYLALRDAPLAEIGQVLAQLSAGQVFVLISVNVLFLSLMTLRWARLLRSLGRPVNVLRLVGMRLAGFGVSYFTPGPQFGGEPVQVDLLRRRGVPLADAISSVFLDRLVDLLANFTFLVIGIVTVAVSGVLAGKTSPAWSGLASLVLLVLPLAHLAALWSGRQPLSWLLARLTAGGARQWLLKAKEVVEQSEAQISALCQAKPGVLLQVLGLSAAIWLLVIGEFLLTLRFLGVQATLIQAISALTAVRLAFLMPLPGGMGVLEASLALVSQAFGWGAAVGIALSLIIRARDLLLASLGMWMGGMAYRKTLINPWVLEERS